MEPRDDAAHAAHIVDRRIAGFARARQGVATTPQLHALGLSRGGLRSRVRRGWLAQRYPGVYRVGLLTGPFFEEMAAVQAVGEDAVLSHHAAAALWRLRAKIDGPIDVTVAGRHARSRTAIRVHNVARVEHTVHRGVPVTTPARTLLDLAATVGAGDLARAVEEARVLRLVTDAQLRALLERHRRRAGTRALSRELAGEPRMTRSAAERRLLDLIRRAGLPLPETNVRVLGHEVDALWRAQRLVVEVDGFDVHGTRAAFERDRRRDARLLAAGHRVIRFTWRQLREEPELVIARLAAALAQL